MFLLRTLFLVPAVSALRATHLILVPLCLFLYVAFGLPAHAAEAASEIKVTENIYLYRSPITQAFFSANGASYSALLNRWREYLTRYGKSFQQVTRASLLAGLKPGVLVLGSAVLLDDQERAAIKAYADGGGSIMVTWGSGARDGKGRWTGYGFIEELLDMKITGGVTRAQDEWFLNTFGDSPLAWELPAGKRIFLGKTAEMPLRVASDRLAGRYLDWSRHPILDNATGAIAYSEKGRSRRVYFSFSESSWEFHPLEELVPLFDGVFAWLLHQPRVYKAAWPQGYLAAQLMEMDTEDKFRNAENFMRDLDAVNMRGTFYSLTSIAMKHQDLVKALSAKHEIGYHAEIHVGFKGKTPAEQERRIKTMVEQMRGIVGTDALPRITGFRAPTESFDATTEKLLRSYGLQHNVANPESSENRLPFFSSAEPGLSSDQAIIVLPRTQSDDLNYRESKISIDKAQILIQKELDYVLEMGALGILSVHSQNYGVDGIMTKLTPSYLKRLQENRASIWVARADEITAWWRARERVSLKSSPNAGSTSLEFSVRAPGGVAGLSFFVTHPAADAVPKTVVAATAGIPQPQIKRIDAFRSTIIFDRLEAGNYSYAIQF